MTSNLFTKCYKSNVSGYKQNYHKYFFFVQYVLITVEPVVKWYIYRIDVRCDSYAMENYYLRRQ